MLLGGRAADNVGWRSFRREGVQNISHAGGGRAAFKAPPSPPWSRERKEVICGPRARAEISPGRTEPRLSAQVQAECGYRRAADETERPVTFDPPPTILLNPEGPLKKKFLTQFFELLTGAEDTPTHAQDTEKKRGNKKL